MRRNAQATWFLLATLAPAAAWAGEAAMPVGAVLLSGTGAAAVGFAGFICFKLYALLRGGELGSAWQTVGLALLFLAVALIVDTVATAGWFAVPAYAAALFKVLAAGGLVLSFIRFARVFQ